MDKEIVVYLSGPMYLGKEQAMGWRDQVKHELNNAGLGFRFKIYDPCDRWLEKGGQLEAEGPFVVAMDKLEIAQSDVLIVNSTHPGWGTPMEQYIAWTAGKIVLCFSTCDFPSIWAYAHCHKMFMTHYDAVNYLIDIVAPQLIRTK